MSSMDYRDSAFLLIDMVNEFVHPEGKLFVAGAAETVPRLAAVLVACRQAGLPVVHVVRQHHPDGSDVESVRREVFSRLGGFCLPGSWGSQIVPGLAPLPEEAVVVKHGWSAFFETTLHRQLRQLGVRTVIVGGTQTPNCVRATVYDATALGYEAVVLSDGTSAATPAVQEANLRDLAALGVPLVSCADLVAALEQGRAERHRPQPCLRAVPPAERAAFTRLAMETIREGDRLLDTAMRSHFLTWCIHGVLQNLFHRRSRALLLEIDGVPAGFIVLRSAGDALRIEALGVLPSFRRQGWGQWLLEYAAEEARRLGQRRLELQVYSGNGPAQALYWQAGFRPIPRLWLEFWLERFLPAQGER